MNSEGGKSLDEQSH